VKIRGIDFLLRPRNALVFHVSPVTPDSALHHQKLNAMEGLLKYFEFVAGYAEDVMKLFSGPKKFVEGKNIDEKANWQRALTFFIISSAISVVLQLFYAPKGTDFNATLSNLAFFGP
jgi:hypothetical protein